MNMKELEEVVKGLVAKMGQLDMQAVQNLSDRVDRVVEGFTAELNVRTDRLTQNFDARCASIEAVTKELHGRIETLNSASDDVQQKVARLDLELETVNVLRATVDEMVPTLEHVRTLVESTNKSAPSKRNMTDADALRVLTGDMKDEAHKEAAEKIGLTYAQVYSCRGEFTFKHVHKTLRDSGWKNPFKKPEPQHK